MKWMIIKTSKSNIFQSLKQVKLLDCQFKQFVSLGIKRKSNALKHLPDIEDLINKTWKNFAILTLLMKKNLKIRKLTISILGSLPKNNWMTFLDKLNTYNKETPNILHIYLFQILLQELISNEKDYKPYWTHAYKELSEKLLSPIEIDYPVSGLTLSNSSLKKQEEQLPLLMIHNISQPNKNSLKTYYQLSTSIVADKWEKEAIKPNNVKALKIKMTLTNQQRTIIDEWINTSRYVYNKTINLINNGHPIDHFQLRDKLVTENTKKNNKEYKDFITELRELTDERKRINVLLQKCAKNANKELLTQLEIQEQKIIDKKKSRTTVIKSLSGEKNTLINEWELNTPKSVRDGAINDVCKAYKTGFSNLKLGNIQFFKMHYKKKSNPDKCVCIPKGLVKNINGTIHLSPHFFKENNTFRMGKKTLKKYKDLVIENDSRIIKQKDIYYLIICVKHTPNEKTSTDNVLKQINYCGVDPGIRTFMTSFGSNGCTEYLHNNKLLKLLNSKISKLKELRTLKKRNRILKRKLNKIEIKKENLINELHWKVITDLLNKNDVIFYGDIKSHDIVKGKSKKNSTLNGNINELKFFKFKERLLFKANEKQKRVILVNEAYTSQTCSNCGFIYKPHCSKIYDCKNCGLKIDRDINASKNILMKGIMCVSI